VTTLSTIAAGLVLVVCGLHGIAVYHPSAYSVEFWERLRELGWTKGQNLLVEERWAEGRIACEKGVTTLQRSNALRISLASV
jgi:hypothetical protein